VLFTHDLKKLEIFLPQFEFKLRRARLVKSKTKYVTDLELYQLGIFIMSKEISFLVLLLFIVNPSVGSVVEDEDELSFRHFDGDRNVTFKNGSTYSGHWTNGLMEGDGVLQMSNGDIYRLTNVEACFKKFL
jgi:hypothetical protein